MSSALRDESQLDPRCGCVVCLFASLLVFVQVCMRRERAGPQVRLWCIIMMLHCAMLAVFRRACCAPWGTRSS
jgi:hypothetical protein